MRERRSPLPFWISFVAFALVACGVAGRGHASGIATSGTIDYPTTPIFRPPPLLPAGGTPPSFTPPPLTTSDPPGSVAVALPPAAPSVFSGPSAVGTDNAYAAFDMVFEHLTAGLAGHGDDADDTVASLTPFTLALNDKQTAQLNDASLAFPAALQERYGAWARGIGTFQSVDSDGAAPGYSGHSGGFLAGLDRGVTPELTLGIAGGYSHTDLSQSDGTSGTIETPRILAYGLYRAGPVALEGTLGFAYDRIGTNRPVACTGTAATQGHNGFEENAALQ